MLIGEEGLTGPISQEFARIEPILQEKEHANCMQEINSGSRNTAQLAIDPAKAEKQIERCLISTFQIAESKGFKGDYRQWEHLLRMGD